MLGYNLKNLSNETKESLEKIAKTENKEVLEQTIEFAQLVGDY